MKAFVVYCSALWTVSLASGQELKMPSSCKAIGVDFAFDGGSLRIDLQCEPEMGAVWLLIIMPNAELNAQNRNSIRERVQPLHLVRQADRNKKLGAPLSEREVSQLIESFQKGISSSEQPSQLQVGAFSILLGIRSSLKITTWGSAAVDEITAGRWYRLFSVSR